MMKTILIGILWVSAQLATGLKRNPMPEPRGFSETEACIRERDFIPAFNSAEEREAFQKRKSFEGIDDGELEMKRRASLEKDLICPGENMDNDDPACYIPGLQISMMYGEGISFCVDCRDAHETGSLIDVWDAHYTPHQYHVDGRMRIMIPNDGRSKVLNTHQVEGNIAVAWRGGVPLNEKVRRAQEAGATAIIIIDNGKCKLGFDCGPILGKRSDFDKYSRGWGSQDLKDLWRNVYIPAVLILKEDGERLLQRIKLQEIKIRDVGMQKMVSESEY